jgi:hypothetical protein
MAFRGDWSLSATYAVNDTCVYNGQLLVANASHSGVEPRVQSNTWSVVGRASLAQNQPSLLHPGYIASRLYPTILTAPATTSVVPAIDTWYLYLFPIFAPITLTSVHTRIATAGTGSSMKAALWANSTRSIRPLGLPVLSDETGVATTGSGEIVSAMAGTLQPGWYWFGSKHTGSPLPQFFSLPASVGLSGYFSGWIASGGMNQSAYTFADAYANASPNFAEGATFNVLSSTAGAPICTLVT